MHFLLVCSVAFLASGLTFFTGFGLGTLLLPAFALFFPAELAVALTAIVHLLNSLFKLLLVGKSADLRIALRFGMPAILSAYLGATLLVWLSDLEPLLSYDLAGSRRDVMPAKLVLAFLMVAFALLEIWPRFKNVFIQPKHLPLGGLATGFFGGLSGHQGAFRSAFLVRAGLSKEAFIATGVVIAATVDLSRLAVYSGILFKAELQGSTGVLAAATVSAFSGALLGNRLLEKVTLRATERAVAVMLIAIALGLGAGIL